MSALTAQQRKNLPKEDFAFPDKAPAHGSYPIDTVSRARNALARVSQFGSEREKTIVRAKVKKRFPHIHVGS